MIPLINATISAIPKWAWLAIIAALSATSCKLKLENGHLSIEVEKHATHIAQLETNIAVSNQQAAEHTAQNQARARAAEQAAASRQAALRRDVVVATTELERLRVALSDYTRPRLAAAPASIPPSLDVADKLPELFLECSRRYGEMARDADIWKNDAVKLYEAWPK